MDPETCAPASLVQTDPEYHLYTFLPLCSALTTKDKRQEKTIKGMTSSRAETSRAVKENNRLRAKRTMNTPPSRIQILFKRFIFSIPYIVVTTDSVYSATI